MGSREKPARARGHLSRGMLAAVLLHANLLAPLLIATFIYAAREEARRAEEVDVGFENVPPDQLPKDLPPLDDTPAPLAKAPRRTVKPDRPEPPQERKKTEKVQRKAEEKLARETPPEPEVVVPPLPPMPEPPPKPPQAKNNQKAVDLDNDKDVEPPPDARYLAQKNNRVDEETRATQTNLEREQKGAEGSQDPKSERHDDKEVGDAKTKIAELEDQKSKLGRSAPEVTPRKESESPEPPQTEPRRQTSPVLTLRDAVPRGHEMTPETVDPSLPHDPAGLLARAKPRGAFRDDEADHPNHAGKRLKLVLSGKDYEYLFGSEAKAERQFAQKERSTRTGKRAQRLAQVRSALENFIPEVKPGNQTALNTRAAPFATFIAHMHRNIHKLWGFGALEDWDELPSSSPFNDESLVTTLEIALNRDGSVSKVTVVRSSKYLPYDAAAIDVVLSAGPYADPPREIRSGDGKIYVTWSFYRDGRQCATGGADPHILNNAPKGGDPPDGSETSPGAEAPAGATAPGVPAGSTTAGAAGSTTGAAGLTTGVAAGATAPGAPAGSTAPGSPTPSEGAGPRRLERNLPESAGARGIGGRRAVAQTLGSPENTGAGAPGEAAEIPRSEDNAAVQFARDWFAAYVRGDVNGMTQRATFPFRSTAGVVAKNRDELAQMLRGLVAETPHRPAAPVTVETAAGLRKLVGKLPPGLDDGSGTLFAVSRAEGDAMILLLARGTKGWQATGLVRR